MKLHFDRPKQPQDAQSSGVCMSWFHMSCGQSWYGVKFGHLIVSSFVKLQVPGQKWRNFACRSCRSSLMAPILHRVRKKLTVSRIYLDCSGPNHVSQRLKFNLFGRMLGFRKTSNWKNTGYICASLCWCAGAVKQNDSCCCCLMVQSRSVCIQEPSGRLMQSWGCWSTNWVSFSDNP